MFLIFISCSKNNSEDDIESQNKVIVNTISPLKAKIGDTLTINGSNLNNLKYVLFKHDMSEYANYSIKVEPKAFISKSNEKITLKVPQLVHEDISIVIPTVNTIALDLVGFIPIIYSFEKISQIYLVDQNTAFLMDNRKIYKSTDGFYHWETVYESPAESGISCIYYLNESDCWIGMYNNPKGISIHYSENGGVNFSLKYQISDLSSGNQINKIHFSSLSKGFFVDNNQEMYVSDNNSWENIYDYYPNLNLLPFGKIEIWDFNAINEDLIFLTANRDPYLIKIENQNITYSEFDISPSLSPLLYGNTGYVQVNSDIFKTTDLGNSWTKIKTFENHYPRIEFLNNLQGLAFVNYTPAEIYSTNDGGVSWEKRLTLPQYHDAHYRDFTDINGLIGSANGRLWKYRKE